MTNVKLGRARKHELPAFVKRTYAPGEKTLFWFAKILKICIAEFISPLTVRNYDEFSNIVLVKDETTDSEPPRFNTVQVVPYVE